MNKQSVDLLTLEGALYAIVAIEPSYDQFLRNRMGRLCKILPLGWSRSNGDGHSFRIAKLQFDTYGPELERAFLLGLDSWMHHTRLLSGVLKTDCDALRQAITMPVPDRPSISWCVQRFMNYYSDLWRDSLSAMGQCRVASDDFLAFLQRYNAVSAEQIASGYARVVWEYRGNPEWATPDFPTEIHAVVGIGRLRIDLTRRQFDPDAPVPTVWICRDPQTNIYPPRTATAAAPALPPV